MYKDLRQRTFNFAVSVAKLILQLPNNLVNRAYFGQIIRSSSSTGPIIGLHKGQNQVGILSTNLKL